MIPRKVRKVKPIRISNGIVNILNIGDAVAEGVSICEQEGRLFQPRQEIVQQTCLQPISQPFIKSPQQEQSSNKINQKQTNIGVNTQTLKTEHGT